MKVKRGVAAGIVTLALLLMPALEGARAAEGGLPQESWFAGFINGQKVGHVHEIVESSVVNGRKIITSVSKGELTIKRLDQVITVTFGESTVESEDGALLECSYYMRQSGVATTVACIIREDVAEVTVKAMGTVQTINVPRSPGMKPIGTYAHANLLKRTDRSPGAVFEYDTFPAALQRFIRFSNQFKGLATVDFFGKETEFTEMSRTDTETGAIETYMLDPDGEVMIIKTGAAGDFYRCSKEQAMQTVDSEKLPDMLLEVTSIPMDFLFLHPWKITEATFRFSADPDIIKALRLPEDSSTVLERGDDFVTATIKPRFTEAALKDTLPIPAQPSLDEFIASDTYVTSEDPVIAGKTREIIGDEKNAWRAAKKLEKWVYLYVAKDFGVGVVPATQVMADPKGDCTELSILFAALARSAGIPTRLVVGFVGIPMTEGFQLHMWDECWLGGEWIQFDAAGLTGARPNAMHIKLLNLSSREQTLSAVVHKIQTILTRLTVETIDYVLNGKRMKPDRERYYGSYEDRLYRNDVLGMEIAVPEGCEARMGKNLMDLFFIPFPAQQAGVGVSVLFMPIYFKLSEMAASLKKTVPGITIKRLKMGKIKLLRCVHPKPSGTDRTQLMRINKNKLLILEVGCKKSTQLSEKAKDGMLRKVLKGIRFK